MSSPALSNESNQNNAPSIHTSRPDDLLEKTPVANYAPQEFEIPNANSSGNSEAFGDVVITGEIPASVKSTIFDDELPIDLHPKQFFESNQHLNSTTTTTITSTSYPYDSFILPNPTTSNHATPLTHTNIVNNSSHNFCIQPLQIQTDFQKFSNNNSGKI